MPSRADAPCIVCDLRKNAVLSWLVAGAVGLVGALFVADALRPERPARSDTPPPPTVPRLSAEQRITRIGNEWAPRFAAGTTGPLCFHMTQPLCEQIVCMHVGGVRIENCTPPTRAFRKSFGGATVEDVAIEGERVAARFSNGEVVELWGDGGTWRVDKIGPNAGRGLFD